MNLKDVRTLDIGCGTNKKAGFFGIDVDPYEGVDLVQDLRFTPLPFEDHQLEEVYASHFLEHLDFHEVIYLFNEVYRCLVVGGKFEIVVPHATSYGYLTDLSHKTAWTEDTFGYFTPDNHYYYSWFYEKEGKRIPVINKWKVLKNDNTPPYKYTVEGWVEVKLREVHAFLEKLE
jgi:predicted SAM-dependent methyltransferase